MPEKPTSNVKIYDRPERKGPPPLVLGILLVVALLVGILLYKTYFHPTALPVKPQVGLVLSPGLPLAFAPQGSPLSS